MNMDPAETSDRAPRWPAPVTGMLCAAGIAVSAYLTYAHYTTAKALACSDKGLVNCAKVTTSGYSRILHIPVSDTGLGYFLAMAALCSPRAWRSTNRFLRALRVLGAFSGVALIVWLVYVELFRLDAICLYCTIVHIITVVVFITIALGTAATGPTLQDDLDDPETTATTGASPTAPILAPKTQRHGRAGSSRTTHP